MSPGKHPARHSNPPAHSGKHARPLAHVAKLAARKPPRPTRLDGSRTARATAGPTDRWPFHCQTTSECRAGLRRRFPLPSSNDSHGPGIERCVSKECPERSRTIPHFGGMRRISGRRKVQRLEIRRNGKARKDGVSTTEGLQRVDLERRRIRPRPWHRRLRLGVGRRAGST